MNKLTIIFIILCYPNFINAQLWDSLSSPINYPIRSFHLDTTHNELYVGGDFFLAGNDTIFCVGKWDGNQWTNLDRGSASPANVQSPPCGSVRNFTEYQGSIYASGAFFEPNKFSIARWNGLTWDSITTLQSGAITSFIEYQNELYVTGIFEKIDTVNAWGIAKWNGQKWSAIDTTKWQLHGIYDVAFYKGELYIGGNFKNANGSIEDLAKWNGTTWEAVSNFNFKGAGTQVFALEVYNDRLYIGGEFRDSEFPGYAIAAWDGTNWDNLGGGLRAATPQSNTFVRNFYQHNGKLYVHGYFWYAGGHITQGGIPASNIAIWNDTSWCGLGSFITNTVNDIIYYKDELYVGMANGLIDSVNYGLIAKWQGGENFDTCSQIVSHTLPVEKKDAINIFPNPTTSTITIATPDFKNKTLTLYSMLGEALETHRLTSPQHELDLSRYAAGMYIVQLSDGRQVWSRKVVKW